MLRLTNKRREEASVKRALTLENEIELIEGCRAGKDSARKELYTLYSKQMLAVCYRYTGDMDAAHDVFRGSVDGVCSGTSRRLPYRVQLVRVRGEVAQGDCGTASYQGAFVYLAVAPCQVYVSEKN